MTAPSKKLRAFSTPILRVGSSSLPQPEPLSESSSERIKRKLEERKHRAVDELEIAEIRHAEAEELRLATEEERKVQILKAGGEIPVTESEGKQDAGKAAEVAAEAVAAGVSTEDAKDLATGKKPVVVITPGAEKNPIHEAANEVLKDIIKERLSGGKGKSEGGSFLEELDRVTNGALTKRVGELLFPGLGGKKEEGGGKSPEEEFFDRLDFGDKVRKKLGITDESTLRTALSGGEEGPLRTELIRLLLEDERERLKIQKEYEAKMAAAGAKTEEAAFIRPLISEGIGALRETASYYNRRAAAKSGGVGAGEQKAKKKIICPNPECKKPFVVEADYKGKIGCPYCEKITTV